LDLDQRRDLADPHGTPLWGTDYDGTFHDTYLAKLGAERMEERLYPYGDLVRSGALVTYGSDIPGSWQ